MNRRWDFSKLTVLIIEDNVHMRGILRSVLAGFGVRQIHEAGEGAEGLEIALERQPDIILCDWLMSPVNGGEFIQFLRADKNPHVATIPVIVVSAKPSKGTIIEAAMAGIHGFVAKPISPAVLYDRVITVLERQSEFGRCKSFFKPIVEGGVARCVDVIGMSRYDAPLAGGSARQWEDTGAATFI